MHGIELDDGSSQNTIGGATAAAENVISNNGEDAIAALETAGDGSAVLSNRGSGNAALFLDLEPPNGAGNNPATGANAGAQAPQIATATQSGASGTAPPGSTVRVYRKAVAAAGELESFLGSAVADGAGSWSLTYPAAVPAGTRITANQTSSSGNSSEFVVPARVSSSPPQPPPPPPPPSADTDPPETITKAPKKKLKAKKKKKVKVSFEFSADEAGASFECNLEGAGFEPCSSPFKAKLKKDRHTFEVRATDAAGNTDATPAKHSFKVKRKKRRR